MPPTFGAGDAGTAHVDVIPNMQNFGRDLAAGVDKSVAGIGGRLKATGATLTKTLTPVAAGIGAAFLTSFNQVDTGLDTIRTTTGATGAELEGLGDVMKSVAGRVTQPISEVGAVVGDLRRRTGATGKTLEGLTERVLQLARVTGVDATELTGRLTRVFGDWSIATEDQAAAMDKLFRASQATGAPVNELADGVVRFGSPLRQLGFSLEETAGLLGKFEKEGVNTNLVMGSLRIGLGKMAKAGEKDLPRALDRAIKKIAQTKDGGKAAAEAIELFGARAGPDMAAAIREGRFDLGELFTTINKGTDTIEKANEDTLDWSDRLAMIKNRVQSVIGPVGEMGFALSGVVAGIGPVLQHADKFGKAFSVMGSAATGLGRGLLSLATNPFVLLTAAIVGIVIIVIKFRKEIVAGLKVVVAAFVTAFKAIVGALAAAGGFILDTVKAIGRGIAAGWRFIAGITRAVWNGIKAVINGVVRVIAGVFRFYFNLYRRIIAGVWAAIKAVTQTVWNVIKTVIVTPIRTIASVVRSVLGGLFNFWRSTWGKFRAVVAGVWNGIKAVVRGAINVLIGIVETGINAFLAPFRTISKLPVIGRAIPDVPVVSIPRLARGGDVRDGGLAIVGDGGVPELVELPRGARVTPLPSREAGEVAGGDTFHIDIHNPRAEPASTSIPAARRRAQLLRGR